MPVSLKSDNESPIVIIWSRSSVVRLTSSFGEEKASSSPVCIRTSLCETQEDLIRKQAGHHLVLDFLAFQTADQFLLFKSTVYGGFLTVSHTDKNKLLLDSYTFCPARLCCSSLSQTDDMSAWPELQQAPPKEQETFTVLPL